MSTVKFATVVATIVALPIVMSACDGDPEPRRAITVSGQVEDVPGGTDIDNPATAGQRVVVAWVVSATSPDYTYVFGQGALSSNGESFSVRLDTPPPDSALNLGWLGVGLIVAVEGPGFEDGDLVPDSGEGIIGLAGRHAIIYIGERGQGPEWTDDFTEGYSVGVGVDLEGTFDGFAPTEPDDVELIIDDLGNIDIVNWT